MNVGKCVPKASLRVRWGDMCRRHPFGSDVAAHVGMWLRMWGCGYVCGDVGMWLRMYYKSTRYDVAI